MEEYITAEQISNGKRIDPVQRIKLMSPDDWEILIEEWLDSTGKYVKVEQIGGAGDMGRDVIAYIEVPKDNPNYKWDCYQCKHYDKVLTPSDIWSEFGKLIYYTFKKEFPIPLKYYFFAPSGIGSKLSSLLDNSSNLKKAVKENWEKYYNTKISFSEKILDFTYGQQHRGDFGKGYRAILYAVFIISMLEYLRTKPYQIGSSMIDSPLNPYKRNDEDDGDKVDDN